MIETKKGRINDISTCRSCGAPIRWIWTTGGKNMPCDAQEIHYSLGGREVFVTADGKVERGTRGGERTGYISHFATCPQADQHRRPR